MTDYYSSGFEPMEVKSIAEKFGFCLVKNIFSAEEVASMEAEMRRLAAANNNVFPDLYSCPTLRWVMLHPKVLDLARALLGDELVYYRETRISFENAAGELTANTYRELHRDGRGNPQDLNGPTEKPGVFGAYRFAVYLRDYRNFSGGLKVAPGTHKLTNEVVNPFRYPNIVPKASCISQMLAPGVIIKGLPVPPFDLYDVPSMPGDLVIFNLNVFHSAGALRPVERPAFSLLPLVETQLASEASGAFMPNPPEGRNAIFFDYGAPTQDADFYIKWRAARGKASDYHDAELSNLHPSAFEIRNDTIIAGLAMGLADTIAIIRRAGHGSSDLSIAGGEAEQLLALCRHHREFSDRHPLFDLARFKELEASDPIAALQVVVDGVRRLQASIPRTTAS